MVLLFHFNVAGRIEVTLMVVFVLQCAFPDMCEETKF
jgi:hypothetical protein